ncbi:fructose-6-phosphate aldolase [Bacillus shivajii]|uniref:transaldolase family protein n=1 Tax=Bacillus shivajii TaxID=1983719 RepID=UPI001CFB95E1|nr:transaldolase family protein [Bacillus shivajii]UCZ54969.1 fructose-6-phosphate aldolase [Bacillus shivajii]
MEILIDSANIKEIIRLSDLYPIDGVTTNPTIISKEKEPFLPLVQDIQRHIGNEKMLHVQTLSTTANDIVNEALHLTNQLDGNVYVKIPVIPEGIKAMRMLHQEEVKLTATAVITPLQALMAAKAGAHYVAPYVNRVSNLSVDGTQVVEEIVNLFNTYKLSTKVLGASFKNVDQIKQVALKGSHAITASPDMIDAMQEHLLTEWSVDQFSSDWQMAFGEKTFIK